MCATICVVTTLVKSDLLPLSGLGDGNKDLPEVRAALEVPERVRRGIERERRVEHGPDLVECQERVQLLQHLARSRLDAMQRHVARSRFSSLLEVTIARAFIATAS